MVPVRLFAEAGLIGAGAVGCGRGPESPAQPHRRLRADHARRPHARAAILRHRQRAGRQPRGRRARGSRLHATPFGTLLRFRKDVERRPAARAGGGAAVRALCHPAAQSGAHAAAGARRLHNRLAQCPRRAASTHGRFGFDDYVDHLIEFAGGAGLARRTSSRSASPACRCSRPRPSWPRRQPGAAAQHDADGGPDRHARQPDQGQRARHEQADRLVRAQPDRARAAALSGGRARGLSGLRAARRLHVDEHRPPPQGASRALRAPGQRRDRRRPRPPRRSTTNTSPCWT